MVKLNVEVCRQAVNFFLNHSAEGELNYWAKPSVLYFCDLHLQCANNGIPFQVSCQDLANRKQDTFRMKTTFISSSWRELRLILYNLQPKKKLKVPNTEFSRQRFCRENSYILLISLPTTKQLRKMRHRQSTTEILKRKESFESVPD